MKLFSRCNDRGGEGGGSGVKQDFANVINQTVDGVVSPDNVVRASTGLNKVVVLGWKGSQFFIASSHGVAESLEIVEEGLADLNYRKKP